MLYLHHILNGFWQIEESFAANYLPVVAQALKGELSTGFQPSAPDSFFHIVCLDDEESRTFPDKEMPTAANAPENSIAVIDVIGAITKYDQFCGPVGVLSLSETLLECYRNQNIKSIVIRVDSGGGEAYACLAMQQAIAGRNKPVIGFIRDFACSAAYGLLSGCDLIVANSPLARIGSIGTLTTLADYSAYYEKQGIRLIEIYASKSTEKNKDFREALCGNVDPLRQVCDRLNEDFISRISAGRSGILTADTQLWATGKVFFADQALALGLIDRIDSFENLIQYFNT